MKFINFQQYINIQFTCRRICIIISLYIVHHCHKDSIRLCTSIWDPNTHLVMEERDERYSKSKQHGRKRSKAYDEGKAKKLTVKQRSIKNIYKKKKKHVQSNTQFRNTTSYKVDKSHSKKRIPPQKQQSSIDDIKTVWRHLLAREATLQQAVQVVLRRLLDLLGDLLWVVLVLIVLEDGDHVVMAKVQGLLHWSVVPPIPGNRVHLARL